MNQVVNWFILIFIFVFDPLAVILLIASNKAFDIISSNTKENIYGEKVVQEYFDARNKKIENIVKDQKEEIKEEIKEEKIEEPIEPPSPGPTGQVIT